MKLFITVLVAFIVSVGTTALFYTFVFSHGGDMRKGIRISELPQKKILNKGDYVMVVSGDKNYRMDIADLNP